MRPPTKPYKPYPPTKPTPTRSIANEVDVGNDILFADALAKLPKDINPLSVHISARTEPDYGGDRTIITLCYYTEDPNPNFDKQMLLYKETHKEYLKEVATYEAKLSKYKKEMIKYEAWKKQMTIKRLENQLEILRAKGSKNG